MQLTRGVWQMSLAMIISGSIGAFVLLSGLPVTDVVFWRCLIGALTLLVFIVLSRLLWSSFFGHADQMVGLCTGGQLGGRAGQRFVLC
ncbi:hypothetical protein NDN89_27660, partial [Klebsiella pneumoniae]|nr:hypothetical protein [Klebsiella pneumoniae]MCT9164626.1 hypothetical protein [Klebsiella pneumoniae]